MINDINVNDILLFVRHNTLTVVDAVALVVECDQKPFTVELKQILHADFFSNLMVGSIINVESEELFSHQTNAYFICDTGYYKGYPYVVVKDTFGNRFVKLNPHHLRLIKEFGSDVSQLDNIGWQHPEIVISKLICPKPTQPRSTQNSLPEESTRA